MNRILAGSGLVRLHCALWRFVAARASIFGMPDRPWQSRGQFSLPLWCYSAVRSLGRGDRPHVTICSFGVVNRAVTSNATLRPPADSSLSPIPSDRLELKKSRFLVGIERNPAHECRSLRQSPDQRLRVSDKLDPAAAAPLLCAGITTYSPLRKWKVGKGQKVGVVGLGGLGHMALKFASAFGAEVTLFTTSPGKSDDAKRLGASGVVISKDEDAMEKQQKRFDFIIDTVSAPHDLNAYLALLKRDGALVVVGIPPQGIPVNLFHLVSRRRQLAGSLIGGIAETQEMLDFCADRGITCDIELISIDKINEAYERMLKSDVKYRFVIDMASL